MIEPILATANLFGTAISLDEHLVTTKQNRYFLLSQNLKKSALKDFFYAGTYLGKKKDGRFFPSFDLLRIIQEKKESSKVIVDRKTEWLYICGRDIFGRGITDITGPGRKDDYVLVLNRHGECLGFGRVLSDLYQKKEGVVINNISDVGDFLRRER